MKRTVLAVILAVIAIAAAICELLYVKNKTDYYISSINKIDELVKEKELSSALSLCEETEKSWYSHTASIDILLIHDYVDSIGISISKMHSYLSSSDEKMYFSESAGAKKALASIKESEYPNFENIL